MMKQLIRSVRSYTTLPMLAPTTGRALAVAFSVALTCAACGSDPEETVDANATYTAFGHPFEPAAALPVQAVLAEPALYLDEAIMVEGLARECQDEPCWMRLPTGDTSEVRILQPDFEVPDTIAGHRIVVHGHLMAPEATSDTTAAAAEPEDAQPSTLAPRPANLTLHPTGLMVEKVRP